MEQIFNELPKYFAWFDVDSNSNIIAFATENEIIDDCLCGDIFVDLSEEGFDIFTDLKNIFDDSEIFGEDYLISTNTSLNDIDTELIKRGFIKDKRIKNIGWG